MVRAVMRNMQELADNGGCWSVNCRCKAPSRHALKQVFVEANDEETAKGIAIEATGLLPVNVRRWIPGTRPSGEGYVEVFTE